MDRLYLLARRWEKNLSIWIFLIIETWHSKLSESFSDNYLNVIQGVFNLARLLYSRRVLIKDKGTALFCFIQIISDRPGREVSLMKAVCFMGVRTWKKSSYNVNQHIGLLYLVHSNPLRMCTTQWLFYIFIS